MLHILLTILKIIGILLLGILALLLVCIGVVLFVPVRYRAEGEKQTDSYFVKAEVYWLFRLFRVKAVYPKPGRVLVKVLWFTLYDSEAEEKPEKEKKQKKKRKSHKQKRQKEEKKSTEQSKSPERENSRNVAEETALDEKTIGEKSTEEKAVEETKQSGEEQGRVGRFFAKCKELLQKILRFLKNIQYTIRRVYDKIKEIWANIQYYAEVFEEEETKNAFALCRQQLSKIWKNIRPKRFEVKMRIGTGEPDTTGYVLALHGMMYPLVGNNIFIEPDFENQVFEGSFFVKGRVTLFVLLYVAVKLYFDENIRYFLKRFKKGGIADGR